MRAWGRGSNDGKSALIFFCLHGTIEAHAHTWSYHGLVSSPSKLGRMIMNKFTPLLAIQILLSGPSAWAEADLKEVDDSDEPYFLPKGCIRKQGAVRQGNQMFVDPTYVNRLSPAQKGMLYLHELFFYVAQRHGQKNSISTRNISQEDRRSRRSPSGPNSARRSPRRLSR